MSFPKTALLIVAAVAGVSAALLWRRPAPPVELAGGVYITPSRALPAFNLIDQRGAPFGPQDLRGGWTLLFFGYTNCPDYCPTTLSALAAMEKRLRAAAAPVLPRVVFVSVDARRDTPAQLSKYVPYFDAQFRGVTAARQPDIEALAHALGVVVVLHPEVNGAYSVDHSAELFVVDPAARITAILTGPFTAAGLAADFQRIVAATPP